MKNVLQTKEYSKFKFHHLNRKPISAHVERLYKSMMKDGWIPGSYMVVDSDNVIIDGQHRLIAAQKANVPVEYVVEAKANVNTIKRINSNSKNWSISDHVKVYVSEGKENYVKLDKFMKAFPDLKITVCGMLLTNSTNHLMREDIESGEFKILDLNLAYLWAQYLMNLKQYFPKGYNKTLFARAMIMALRSPMFRFTDFYHKVKLRPRSLVLCGSSEDYLKMIQEIYNYRRSKQSKFEIK